MIRAAQYLRVSSEQQQHTLPAQAAEIATFAAAHGYDIVRTYEDCGHSGLYLKGRTALQTLLTDVLSGACPYEAILVQDVSRWGRFQDTDEAAHYEYLCRAAGVAIRYCAEPFDAGDRRSADLIKAVKRLMAADFSRELSGKVRAAQFRHARAGFKMGGVAGYGLRRAIIGPDGAVTAILERGQQRLLRGDRVIFVPGPKHEVQTVRRIFRMFLDDGLSMTAIAAKLNAEGTPGEAGRPWGDWTIGGLLSNPKYAGGYRFGRRRRTLDGGRVDSPYAQVIDLDGVFEPIVPRAWIKAAVARRRRRLIILPRAETWRRMRLRAARTGRLTLADVESAAELPSPKTCKTHFGPWPRIAARLGLYPGFLSGQIDKRSRRGDQALTASGVSSVAAQFTAFLADRRLASGDLETVALAAHAAQDRRTEMPIIFEDSTGAVVDLDLRGDAADVVERLRATAEAATSEPARGRGRPKLGVTAREVTLLPKHWTWLQTQPGGASAALRRLVEDAQETHLEADQRRSAQTAAYKVMQALAGHRAGYEEALRALYAGESQRFETLIAPWPPAISAYIADLARPSFR